MRIGSINRGWRFGHGPMDNVGRLTGKLDERIVDLPHDYMIEGDVFPEAPSQRSSGYYNAGVAHYWREIDIPAEWAGDRVALRLDGAMMNATVEVNGAKALLHHYGYTPFEADITRLVYPGEKNTVVITVNPSMQPNSRWYSGAGLFRGVDLVHTPRLHVAFGGLSGWTRKIEYAADGSPETAYLQVSAEVCNECAENRLAAVEFALIDDVSGETVRAGKALVQVPPLSSATAYTALTVDAPRLWSAEAPNLYRLVARVKEAGTYKTRIIPSEAPSVDEEGVLFGIRTIEADVKHGLRINGRVVKLKGGCLHHDNGVIGAVSLYDAEARKVRLLKSVGFNAIRTTHNPPSAALIEACDRLGMYVFDEAFDAWGMGKQPGDYNQFFDGDWAGDLAAFVRRDRCHPSVILWSTGNEITERAGLNDGYVWATRLAEAVRALDPSRPVSNGICSFWNGLDDRMMGDQLARRDEAAGGLQNADLGGEGDLLWEKYTEAFANGLDIVGYNYLEDKYARDHELFPERVILGSENFPVEVGRHWPMIERTPWVIGEFTWTAWDYIGEAGIGQSVFREAAARNYADTWSIGAPYPWRTANDADIDITGGILPQGVYRRIVWGSPETGLFSYDPANFGKKELLTRWGFPGVRESWNWAGSEGRPVNVLVFSGAEEVELLVNGRRVGRVRTGEATVHDMPGSFLFHTAYEPGTLEAISYSGGKEVSRAALRTTGAAHGLRLVPETKALSADGASLAYIRVDVVDADGNVVPDAEVKLTARASGAAYLLGFGSANPVTDENYSRGEFTSYRGSALAVLRAGYEAGEARLRVSAEGIGEAEIALPVKA
ncbi:MAG: glycoside hydrolase family 2 TIM barrel-domain containing protein [Clostridia bacterium]|nr:glycoside hydrolase family 2 TIM barrel-domain containing protein [Clostridia bacterium]